ncbi:MAG: diadenylate cyclase CdaA [Anaerolineales bacterium]|jgi:diadenylate cyclase
MSDFFENLALLFQRLDWLGLLDIGLVTLVFFSILTAFRGTRAGVMLRGVVILIAAVALLTGFARLPAFSWLLRTALPALLIALPVVFAPEIRRALERLGRAGFPRRTSTSEKVPAYLNPVVTAAQRLAERRHGALIVIEGDVPLGDFAETGVRMESLVSPELLLQIFYPGTPLHDGAVILRGERVVAAGCVVPLSSSGSLSPSPERTMGLRHRAALGVSEVSDGVAVVVSEETGIISVAHNGRMIRRLDVPRLQSILQAFARSPGVPSAVDWLRTHLGLSQAVPRRPRDADAGTSDSKKEGAPG